MFNKIFGRKDTNVKIIATDSTDIISSSVTCKENETTKPEEQVEDNTKIDVIPTSEVNATVNSKENEDVVIRPRDDVKKEEPPPLGYKEMRSLKRARYEYIMNDPKYKKAYLLKNKKTGQMAEIRAASSFHACNIIGWKVNRVHLIGEREIKEKTKEEPKEASISETTGSSNPINPPSPA